MHFICFNTCSWKETAEGHWTGVMGGRVWTLTQTDDTLWYYIYTNHNSQSGGGVSLQDNNKRAKRRSKDDQRKDEEEPQAVSSQQDSDMEAEVMLREYFQLHVKLGDLYREWGETDPHFKKIADVFTGLCLCVCMINIPQ